jgi:hypothetical protein
VLRLTEEKEDVGNIGSEFENVSYELGREDWDCEECQAEKGDGCSEAEQRKVT